MLSDSQRPLDQMKYPKNKLIEILKANREKHVRAYEEAVKQYKAELKEELEDMLDDLENGDGLPDTHIHLVKPLSFADSYDMGIAMFELCTDQEIYLSRQEFSQFVMDKWDWNNIFQSNTMAYNVKAIRR